MIDVHILLMGNERQDWLDQCIESLRDEPITLHKCEGIPGDIREARARAIQCGTHDYIGWVDPDDYIIPGAYSRLLETIGLYKFAWAKEQIWELDDAGDILKRKIDWYAPHHMHIVHRSILDYNIIRNAPERRPDSWVEGLRNSGIFDDRVGYIWRRFANSGSAKLFAEHDAKLMKSSINK